VKKMLAALGCTIAVLLGSVAYNPPLAAADIPVHAWNTSPMRPVLFYRFPVGVSSFSTGDYTNAKLVATCVLKLHGVDAWRGDGCDFDWFDVDRTGLDHCWYNAEERRWVGTFITQTWLSVEASKGVWRPVVLRSAPVVLTCYGSRSA